VLVLCRSGEVFKADGEIVASFGGPSSSTSILPAYSLVTGQPVPLPKPKAANNTPATGHQHGTAEAEAEAAVTAVAADSRSAAEQMKRLKQLAEAQEIVLCAERDLEAARLAHLQHQHHLAAAEQNLQRLQQQQQQSLRGRVHTNSAELMQLQLQAALQRQKAAIGELTAAEIAWCKVQQQLETLQQQLAAAAAGGDPAGSKSRTAADRRGQKGTVGRGPTVAAVEELQEAQSAAAEAAAAVEEAWREVHKSEQQQKRAASRAAAINKEIGKVQAAMDANNTEHMQVRCWSQLVDSGVYMADQLITGKFHAPKQWLFAFSPVQELCACHGAYIPDASSTANTPCESLQPCSGTYKPVLLLLFPCRLSLMGYSSSCQTLRQDYIRPGSR
jgi:hypothetical protein